MRLWIAWMLGVLVLFGGAWHMPVLFAQPITGFIVRAYEIRGERLSSTNELMTSLAKYTGTNVTMSEVVKAASELQSNYVRDRGVAMSIAIPWPVGTNGVVTMNVFRAARPQVLVAGKSITVEAATAIEIAGTNASTNAAAGPGAGGGKTNAPLRFTVRAYEIHGDTLLSTEQLTKVFAKYIGTNVTVPDIGKAASELQVEYAQRGYATVKVLIPQQSITNAMVKILVLEGRLAEILVRNNNYFSSNNVMRSLPSLRTNILLNSAMLQAELDRANANRDRQIYAELEPGPESNTSALVLRVKDQLPLHGRLEVNNNSTPGTTEQRVNANLSYDNLWQYEHSFGLQYGFSPESWKGPPVPGYPTSFLDDPAVTYYGAFYRAPLSSQQGVTEALNNNPTQFGYNEATHRFELPPSTGRAELSIYATRATTDSTLTGPVRSVVSQTSSNTLFTVDNQDLQRTVSRDSTAGTRLSLPSANSAIFHSSWSLGLDYKDHVTTTLSTNVTFVTVSSETEQGQPVHKTTRFDIPQGSSHSQVAYLPLQIGWNGNETDRWGQTSGGLFCTFTPADTFSGAQDFQQSTGSTEASGVFAALRMRMSRDQQLFKQWRLSVSGEGQVASQPLVSLEQFGIGGLGSVRGYQEGEVYGDNGWYSQVELRAPYLGFAPNVGLNLSAFSDYGQAFLIDPQGRPAHWDLWGAGFAGSLDLGIHFSGRVAVAWPLLDSPSRTAGTLRVAFGLSAQF